jgi:acetoin utilization protein AcuB
MYEFLDYRVADVMTKNPVTVTPETAIAKAEELLERHGWNALPVVEGGSRLVGMVTSLDLLKAFRFTEDRLFPPYEEIMGRPVREVMTEKLTTVSPRTPLTRALEKMVKTRNKSLPVALGGELHGILAREDVLNALRRAVAGERPTTPL